MANSSSREVRPSLEDYSTFQYMLARPSIARAVVDQTTSFVFYNEPHDVRKQEAEHQILVRGTITVVNYYCCCLVVLLSHVLGMSRWESSEDCETPKNDRECKKAKLQPGDTLRRFRYSYYWGLIRVETRHVFVGFGNSGKDQRFRLVEYMECPISPWAIVHAMFALAASILVYCLRQCTQIEVSFIPGIALVLVVLHPVLALTGVQMWPFL